MSKIIYEKINEKYIKLKSYINNTSSFRNTYLESLELLLKIINDKTDDEFNDFYIKYMSNFQLKRYYFARLFDPFKECNFNKFDNLNDFLNKSYLSPCNVNEEFYFIELNKFLNDILIINLKLESEKQEKLELIKKEEEIKMKIIKEAIKKEVVKKVKKTSTKSDVKKSENIIDNNDKKKKKKPISAAIKRLVWNTNIGEDVSKSKCMCCYSTDITQMSFNCGHIVADANGGETIVSNLKPICQNCNSSMGTKNMEEFMKSLK